MSPHRLDFLLRPQSLRAMSMQEKGKSDLFLREDQRWGRLWTAVRNYYSSCHNWEDLMVAISPIL